MEGKSFKLRKLDEASGSKQSKRQFILKRKTLTQNSRKLVEQKFSSRPPLTPLHRLRRFKAIRDKNLLNKGNKKMEDKLTIPEEPIAIDSVKSNNMEKLEKINGLQEDTVSDKQLTNGGSSVSNGHEVQSQKESFDDEINGKRNTKEGDTSPISKENNSFKEESNDGEHNSSSTKGDEQHINNSALNKEDSKSPSADENLPLNVDEKTSKDLSKNDEENDGSSCSSSTFSSSKRLLSSLEDISEPNQSPNENTEEEESEEEDDRLSNKDDKNENPKDNEALREPPPPEEVKIHQIPSKIPRSISNASSYKSTYGGFQSISGRRAVRSYYRSSDCRKRKADQLETSGNSADSPSQLSPRWRYFPSSISKLWSPRSTPFVFSDTSTPLKNFNDSMTVNVDDTINYHLNDSDLFSNPRETPSSSNKRARWGCSIM